MKFYLKEQAPIGCRARALNGHDAMCSHGIGSNTLLGTSLSGLVASSFRISLL